MSMVTQLIKIRLSNQRTSYETCPRICYDLSLIMFGTERITLVYIKVKLYESKIYS